MTRILEKPIKKKPDSKKEAGHFRKAWARRPEQGRPLTPERKAEIMASLKKTREELWDQYLASRPRH